MTGNSKYPRNASLGRIGLLRVQSSSSPHRSYPYSLPPFPVNPQISGDQSILEIVREAWFGLYPNLKNAWKPERFAGWTVNTINGIKALDFMRIYADQAVGQVPLVVTT